MEGLEKEFTEHFATSCKGMGMDDLSLKVFSILFLEPEEIAMEEIAKRTGYSLASISNTMKNLEIVGFVQRTRKPGSKKVFFFMDKDIIKMNIQKMIYASENMIKPAKQKLPEMIKKYKDKAKTENSKKKITIIQNYYDQMLIFEKIIEKWTKDLENIAK
jgi:DNA-binding transcriptional regulator GbsR (MarR family)